MLGCSTVIPYSSVNVKTEVRPRLCYSLIVQLPLLDSLASSLARWLMYPPKVYVLYR